jgi:hypothetical protein
MVSWNVEPQPPEIIGPWFLWNLHIDERYQGRGHGREAVWQVAELAGAEGAAELLTSYVPGAGGPAGFYEGLGFVPTGDRDANDEIIVGLRCPGRSSASLRAVSAARTRRSEVLTDARRQPAHPRPGHTQDGMWRHSGRALAMHKTYGLGCCHLAVCVGLKLDPQVVRAWSIST